MNVAYMVRHLDFFHKKTPNTTALDVFILQNCIKIDTKFNQFSNLPEKFCEAF